MSDFIIQEQPLEVAIVGGGIIGLVLALGLIRRGVKVKVYEQARSLREIGAGVAFTANAIKCMELIEPDIVAALRSVATSNGDPNNPNDYLQWVDGYSKNTENPTKEEVLFKLYAGVRGFEGCHRAHFLDALVKYLPEGLVEFRKRLDTVTDRQDGGKVELKFCDGTSAQADAVVGCDGIKSRVRELLLGEGNPASYPHYSHKIAYRGLIPMDKAVEVLGDYKAKNQHMHIGPKAHVLHFPVAGQTLMNVVAFVNDPEEWQDDEKMVAPGKRSDVEAAFTDWAPTVRSIISLLPEELEAWAVFDSFDHPAPYYNQGRVCLAGDAAHASSPHHGAGAGFGIEDALCLSKLLDQATATAKEGRSSAAVAVSLAFDAFNATRKERTQWLVNSSRGICEVYEWAGPTTGPDPEKCFAEIKWRSHAIWYFDYDGMLDQASAGYDQRLRTLEEVAGLTELPLLPGAVEASHKLVVAPVAA